MIATTAHYDRLYHRTLLREMLDDRQFYRLKSQCAARQYFGDLPPGKVLEYGCGIGQNIAALPDAVGFDTSPEALELCHELGVPTLAGRDEIPRNHFDYVLCRHVLEHLEQPLDALRELLQYLNDDGLLVLVLPWERQRHVDFAPDIHRHLYCWNFRAINNLIHAAGGEPVYNRFEPLYGPLTYRLLHPIYRSLGLGAYYRLARVAGRLFAGVELVVHARRKKSP